MKGACVILQSGGPTSVINSSLAGIIDSAKKNENITNIYGSLYGIDGIINDNLVELKLSDEEIDLLKVTPAAALGSVRHILPENYNDEVYEKIKKCLDKYDVKYLFLIGGNDSMDTVNKLSHVLNNINVIGVPKTIDNDLELIDHSPGYGSAIKYIANTVSEIELDINSYEKGRVTIIEIMGRDAGWLTAGSKLSSLNGNGPDLIYLPELVFDLESFLKDVSEIYEKKKRVLICVSEGIRDKNGEYILNSYKYLTSNDVFGHQQLGGVSSVLAEIVHERIDIPVRSIELNLMQRCASHISSLFDVNEAFNIGSYALKEATNGLNAKMITINSDGSLSSTDVSSVANKVKTFPLEWIINGNDISEEYIKYAKRLIVGEPEIKYIDGMRTSFKINK